MCGALGRPVVDLCDHDQYEAALRRLKSDGISVTAFGEVGFTGAATTAFSAGPWKNDATVKELTEFTPRCTKDMMGQGSKLHSRILRCMSVLTATAVHGALAGPFEKEVMLSAGGHMVGKFWSELPCLVSHFMDNDHFRMSLQIRLALVVMPPGAVCQT